MKKIFKIISTFIKVRYFSKWTSRDKLLEYQEKEVERHLKFLKENSPYFRTHKITKDFTMNKAFMMENFDELNTLGVKKDEAMDVALNSEKTRNFSQKYKDISVGYHQVHLVIEECLSQHQKNKEYGQVLSLLSCFLKIIFLDIK